MENYFEILGVAKNAPDHFIKNAYRYQMRKLHPDKTLKLDDVERKKRAEQLIRVQKAYETLKDPKKRFEYCKALLKGRCFW
jgi:DnaJ-class molecular chaperone